MTSCVSLGWMLLCECPLCHSLVTDLSVLCCQVEHQYSHRFRVTVVSAENVTKGALGDLCECRLVFCSWPQVLQQTFAYDEACIVFLFLNSGHARPICGAFNPDCSWIEKKNTSHRQWHQSKVERNVRVPSGPRTGQRAGGENFYYWIYLQILIIRSNSIQLHTTALLSCWVLINFL